MLQPRRALLILAAALLLLASAAGAGTPLGTRLARSPWLLGDPGGLRTGLAERGLSVELFANHQFGLLLRDEEHHEKAHSGSVDLFLRADLEHLGFRPGGRALLQLKGNYNRNVNPDLAALGDPIDDADFDQALWVDQLWWERGFFGEGLRARVGYLDYQTSFDRNAYANSEDRQFLHTFLDNNPLVPTRIGLGAMLMVRVGESLELAAGFVDADNRARRSGFRTVFDGTRSWTTLFEAKLRTRLGPELPGALRVGTFRDGSRRRVFGREREERGHWGAYLSADQALWREAGDPGQGLGLFARLGLARARVSRVEAFWSAGLSYEGPLPGRDHDGLGLAVYQTLPSGDYREHSDESFGHETGIELYYRLQLTPWLALTPDLQWIRDPGGSESTRDALLLVLRLRLRL